MKLDVSFNLMLVKIILVFKLFFVSIACKLAMTLEWLMYLVVHQNLVMSGNGVSTWSVECDNCKCNFLTLKMYLSKVGRPSCSLQYTC